jgi:AcrR family transcriptional regulator
VLLDAAARVLSRRGYARTTTNHVAETAGVSVGSLYQYFPNKDSLIAALHQRHAERMQVVVDEALASGRGRSLAATTRTLVRALVAAHRLEPALHRVLESEVPHLDRFDGVDEIDRSFVARVRARLETHRDEIRMCDLDLAAFILTQGLHPLIHAAAIDPPATVSPAEIEAEIVRLALGYLTSSRRSAALG